MNLTELQIELRALQQQLIFLEGEIEKMKPKDEVEKAINYDIITKLAEKQPICNENLQSQPDSVRKTYLGALMFFAAVNNECLAEKLLFIARIAAGLKTEEYTAEWIHRAGIGMNEENLEDACKTLHDLKYSFITDMMITVNISGDDESLAAAADMIHMLGCERENAAVAATLAKAVLTNDLSLLEGMDADNKVWGGRFFHYISESWIVENRVYCDKYRCNTREDIYSLGIVGLSFTECKVKTHKKNLVYVKKGEKLVTYEEEGDVFWLAERNHAPEQHTIKAKCDGLVFFAKDKLKNKKDKYDNFEFVYVVSCFDSYDKFKKWLKKHNK